jgi:transcriptional regulator with XRE-family HTH domain
MKLTGGGDMKDILDYKAVGSRVRERRMKLNLTQEQLAEKADISPAFVGHIERGEKKASLETMSRLVMGLGTTMDYLVLGINCRCDQQTCELYNDLQELLDSYGKGMQSRRMP